MLKSFKEKSFYHPLIIWLIIVFWYSIFAYNFSNIFRLKCQDIFASHAFYLFHKPPKEAEDIVIVTIDEASRLKLNLKWPWRRSVTAQLIRNIASFSPRVIGLDIIFSGKSQEDEDKELASALRSHPKVVLGYVLREKSKELPLPEFAEAAKSVGFINKPLDEDDVIRNVRNFYIDEERNVGFSLDIELIANYLDISHREIKSGEKGIFLGNKLLIPSRLSITPLNYLVHHNDFITVPAFSVLDKKINPRIFKDKIVLVGATDPLIHDEYFTPLGLFPAVTIIGNSLVMMLSERFIYGAPPWQTFFIILALGILILCINMSAPFGRASFFTFLILSAAFLGCLYLRSRDIQFDYFGIFFLSIFSYVASNIYKYSYLAYIGNKLKNLAIIDPLTSLYTLRFFSLKLDERLRNKSENLIILAVVISEYRKLSLDLKFEELKSLIKLSAEYIKFNSEKAFKRISFFQVSRDIIGIALWEEKKEMAEKFFKDLLGKFNEDEFKIGGKTAKVSLKGILLYKAKDIKVRSSQIIYKMKSLSEAIKSQPRKYFISTELEEELLRAKDEYSKKDILEFLVSDSEERNRDLERSLKEVLESKKETEEAYFGVTRSLIKALEEKDTYTEGHSERVAVNARRMAHQVGLSDKESEQIYKAALLHDIGKIGVPDHILHKREKLNEEEIGFIRRHEVDSVEILKPIKAYRDLLPIILHHHECFDGTGYPHGLGGDMIPRGAQILAVADVFDAIACGRGYKKGKGIQEAIEELEGQKEKRLNPVYVEALKEVLKAD